MPDNIDKTRIERTGLRTFTGSGVDTIPDVMEENIDLRQQIQDWINEALSNVTGATVIQDVPDQLTYQFGGGGASQSQLNNAITQLGGDIRSMMAALIKDLMRSFLKISAEIQQLRMRINNLQSGENAVGHGCSLRTSGTQTIPNGFVKTKLINLSVVQYDTDQLYDSGNSQIIVTSPGLYFTSALVNFGGSEESKSHAMVVDLNGANKLTAQLYSIIFTGGDVIHQLGTNDVLPLSAGDVLSVHVFQGTTGNIEATNARLTVKKVP